jgi:hypothetical protein
MGVAWFAALITYGVGWYLCRRAQPGAVSQAS